MSGVQIGRVGGDLEVQSVASESWDGGRVTVALVLRAATLADLLALREQVLGLADNPDEPVVPVIVDGDDRLTGFYTVGSVSVEDPAGAHAFLQLSGSVQLERVSGASAPLIEARTVFAQRSGSYTATSWQAVSGTAAGYSAGGTVTDATRSTDTGLVRVLTGATLATARPQWWQSPDSWYDGASSLLVGSVDASSQPGSTLFSFTGGSQTYTVPAGQTVLTYEVAGASGSGFPYSNSGVGAVVSGVMAVTPGQTFTVNVGGQGAATANGAVATGGWNGGGNGGYNTGLDLTGPGGGGASDLRTAGTGLGDRVVVAGGGGGDTEGPYQSGNGAKNGGAGSPWGYGAGGGTQSAGGAAAVTISGGIAATAGTSGQGGTGSGGSPTLAHYGPGGGGGYYGGGGGAYTSLGAPTSGAGGGSSLVPAGATIVTRNAGHGSIRLTPSTDTPQTLVSPHVIVGRQTPNVPLAWALTNGVIRVRPLSDPAATAIFVEAWDGAKWCAGHTFRVLDYTSGSRAGTTTSVRAVTVLRNASEAVAVRLTFDDTSSPSVSYTWDLTLRRGAAHVETRWSASATGKWGVGHAPGATGVTTVTGTVAATSPDADGNTWLVASPEVSTADTGTGALRLTTTGVQFRAGVGFSIGTPGSGIDSVSGVAAQYQSGGSETVRVVGR